MRVAGALLAAFAWLGTTTDSPDAPGAASPAQIGIRFALTSVAACYMFLPAKWQLLKTRLYDVHMTLAAAALMLLHVFARLDQELVEPRFATPSHACRIIIVYTCAVSWLWLKPWRIW